jgi:probable addiction module antidote protein
VRVNARIRRLSLGDAGDVRPAGEGVSELRADDGPGYRVYFILGDIARAKGMTQIARETGLGRESLYRALSPDGNPELATVLKVIKALGLRLHASAASP